MANKSNKPTSIYVCCDPSTLEPRYVGKTVSRVEKRIYTHVSKIETNHASNWFRKVKTPYYFVVEVVPPGGDWIEAERFWIAYLKSLGARLTNSTDGGDGLYFDYNSQKSKDVRLKMSIAASKPERVAKLAERNKQVDWTEERRRKAGAAKKDKPLSEEHKANVSAAMIGKSKSKETCENMSKARMGKPIPPESIAKRTATRAANRLAKQYKFLPENAIKWVENE